MTADNLIGLVTSASFNESPGSLLEKALLLFERKIVRSGHGLRSYWFICALCDIQQVAPVVHQRRGVYEEIVDKLNRLYGNFLVLQSGTLNDRERAEVAQLTQLNGSAYDMSHTNTATASTYDAVSQSLRKTHNSTGETDPS